MRSWVLMRGAHIYPAIATAGGTKMEVEDENEDEDEDESMARRSLHSLRSPGVNENPSGQRGRAES